MKKLIYIIIVVVALGSITSSCSHRLCAAYGPQHNK